MEIDFPAAHSMDATWFAIDALGHVAMFNSGENGHVPIYAPSDDHLEVLWQLRRGPSEDEDLWDLDDEDLSSRLGLFAYEYDGSQFDPIGFYYRTAVPSTPIHIDQLPPEIRNAWQIVTFPDLQFTEHDCVQPLEFFHCTYWYDYRVAYLCADDKTVRAIPGQEEKFREFVEEFRNNEPERAAQLTFAGAEPLRPPAKKPSGPKKRRK